MRCILIHGQLQKIRILAEHNAYHHHALKIENSRIKKDQENLNKTIELMHKKHFDLESAVNDASKFLAHVPYVAGSGLGIGLFILIIGIIFAGCFCCFKNTYLGL